MKRTVQPDLSLHEPRLLDVVDGIRAIEEDDFPFEAISHIAERESWRKEINRPIYHVHKWWAQRLGSVFRSITIGALAPSGVDVLSAFYNATRFPKAIVFDPFMGSGTTVGEALKLGCRAIGRDINPVAYFLVRNALEKHSLADIEDAFAKLTQFAKTEIEQYYRCRGPYGEEATALYFFWTKTLPCPSCETEVDLMGSRVFARHAYPSRHPESQSLCPHCGEINEVRFDAHNAKCKGCLKEFDPQSGNAKGQKATCPACGEVFSIAATARRGKSPPNHKLYAKLVLTAAGQKHYLRADPQDLAVFGEAHKRLATEPDLYPVVALEPGYNTNQVLNYGYQYWHEMFNSRQLLCLGLLARAIRGISQPEVRDAFACLFSGVLEFNNMFASYKGEGTGAVRHMFYHHILKPERTPLEANLWGTPKSSGSFSGMFRTRLKRALDYAASPFEITLEGGKVFGLSEEMGAEYAETFREFQNAKSLYLSCGDSARTDIADKSVDAVITDPPFFDNVNYSQLADFFYVWQRHILGSNSVASTRSQHEVQHQDADVFSSRLSGVFGECHRVLKDSGVMVFSYHHSRNEGWTSVLNAIADSGFVVTATLPIKAEMSGATPKNQAKEPIDLDIIIVCRKWGGDATNGIKADPLNKARSQISRLRQSGRKLSRNDIRIVLMGQLLRSVSQGNATTDVFVADSVEKWIDDLHTT